VEAEEDPEGSKNHKNYTLTFFVTTYENIFHPSAIIGIKYLPFTSKTSRRGS
jgi:hypothetical protein